MTILTIQPSGKDGFFRKVQPTENTGGSVDISVYNRLSRIRRSVLEFDISGIPGGAEISSATLGLYYYNHAYDDPSGLTVWAYKLTRIDWVELEATWDIYKTGSNWTAAGGDYVTTNPAGGSTTFPADYGWMSWDVKAIVEKAISDAWSVAELLIKFETESLEADYSLPVFHSNNYVDDLAKRPKLVIDYTFVAAGRSFGFIIG